MEHREKTKDFETILKETLQGKESIIYDEEKGFTSFGVLLFIYLGIALIEGLFYGKK